VSPRAGSCCCPGRGLWRCSRHTRGLADFDHWWSLRLHPGGDDTRPARAHSHATTRRCHAFPSLPSWPAPQWRLSPPEDTLAERILTEPGVVRSWRSSRSNRGLAPSLVCYAWRWSADQVVPPAHLRRRPGLSSIYGSLARSVAEYQVLKLQFGERPDGHERGRKFHAPSALTSQKHGPRPNWMMRLP
jgi:hypothetical protein